MADEEAPILPESVATLDPLATEFVPTRNTGERGGDLALISGDGDDEHGSNLNNAKLAEESLPIDPSVSMPEYTHPAIMVADEEAPVENAGAWMEPIPEADEESVSSRNIEVGGSGHFPLKVVVDQAEEGKSHLADSSHLYLKNAILADPLPTDASLSSADQQSNPIKQPRRAVRPASSYRWTLIAVAATMAVLVLSIALPLTLLTEKKEQYAPAESDGPNIGVVTGGGEAPAESDGPNIGVVTGGDDSPPVVVPKPASPASTPLEEELREFLQLVLPTDLYERMTKDIASSDYASFQLLLQDDPAIAPPTLQRFVLAQWDNSVGGSAFQVNVAECQWDGIQCDSNNTVQAIQWSNRNLSGRLPDSMLSSLTTIDLGDNALRGSIPSSWYQNATSLQYLYLHNNALTGTISTHVAQWESLQRLYLGGNQLTGGLPQELGSASSGRDNARPLEYLLLQDNNFNGSLPLKWNLRNLFYLDLGNNQLTGGIPTDWVQGNDRMIFLRLLYLDHNRFSGTLPARLGEIGNGRLSLLSIHDNAFTGTMPLFYNFTTKLNVMEIQNNDLTDMDKDMCKHSVYEEGEMIRLTADCGVCPCKNLCSDECSSNNDKNKLF